MVSIPTLLEVLGGVTDSATIIQGVRNKLRNLSANKIYIDLLDEQFRNERSHNKLDIHLDKKKMQQAMRQSAVDLKRAPLTADELDTAIGDSIVAILMKGIVISGSSDLDEYRAKAIVKRVHQQYFEKVKTEIPELVEVLQYREVSQRLSALNITLNNLRLEQSQHSRTLNRIAQNTDEISDIVQRTSLQIGHSQLSQETSQQEILDTLNQLAMLIAPSDSRISFESVASADTPPQFGVLYTNRAEITERMINQLNGHNWLAVIGQTGSGKTGLAAIIHASGRYQARWISFLGYDGNEAREHLHEQLSLWLKDVSQKTQSNILDFRLKFDQLTDVVASSLQNGLLILDNLPDQADPSNDLLYQDLQQIGRSFSTRNIPILSTGQHGLPAAITSTLSTVSLDAPSLSNVEIAEMLQSVKATPYYLRESTITYIRAVTKGLAALVAAYIVWYQRHNWPHSAEFIESILTDEPGIELREEHQRRLYRLLEDNAIELLLRLSLLVSDFDSTLVKRVAQIPDEILHPHFAFSELKNVWVAQLETDRYQVSPLLKDIGRKNLSVEKQRLVASFVADFYMEERQPLGLDDVLDISLYLWSASRQTDYALFLVQALVQVTNASQAKYLGWATFVPSPEIGFSDNVPVFLQIIFRTQQLRVALLAKGPVLEIEKEMERLISIATDEDAGAIIYAYVIIGSTQATSSSQLPTFPFEKSLRWTFRALELIQEAPTAFENLRQQLKGDTSTTDNQELITDPSHLGNIVWFWVEKINTQDRVLLFLEEIYHASKEVRDAIFSASLASETLPFILDQLWLLEGKKSAESQNWNTLVQIYDRALEFAQEHDIPALKVAAARAKAITLSDIEKGLDSALAVMSSLHLTSDSALVAWINITLALLHNDFGFPENARSYLEKVIELPGAVAEQWRTTMRKHLMVAFSKLGLWKEAKWQGITALKETRDSNHPQYSRLEILGELAFVHWNMRDSKRTFGTLYAIYNFLQKADQFTIEEFNEIYHKFTYALRWYATIGPQSSFDLSNETNLRPIEPGFFSRSLPNLRTYEHNLGNTLLGPAALLNFLAVETDAHRIAWYVWQHIKQSAELEGTLFKLFTHTHGASLEARFGLPAQAIAYGVASFKLKSLSQRPLDLKNPQDLLGEVNVEAGWSALSDSQQASFESLLLYEVLIPLFMELLARNTSKTEIIEILQEYRVSMKKYADLHSYKSFQQTVDHFEQLLLARANRILAPVTKTGVEAVDLLGTLSTYDINSALGIQAKLQVQVNIASHIWNNRHYIPVKHTMYPLGRLFYTFWKNAVKNQRFLLSRPDFMEKELQQISSVRSEKTVAKVLKIASSGLNIELPKSTTVLLNDMLEDRIENSL